MLEEILETRRNAMMTRLVLGAIGLFFISMFMSCTELRYMVSGKTALGYASTRVEKREEDGRSYTARVMGYTYVDGDQNRQRYFDVPLDWSGANAKQVKVQYIPGRDISRLDGEHSYGWVLLFLGSLVASGIGLFVMSRSSE
ncbi:MAG TPA: hypothetical protein VGN88_01870 [Phycisphaerae bacterium]